MKYDPAEARCVFVDGPVAVFVSQAPAAEILPAFDRTRRLVEIAAAQMNARQQLKEDDDELPSRIG